MKDTEALFFRKQCVVSKMLYRVYVSHDPTHILFSVYLWDFWFIFGFDLFLFIFIYLIYLGIFQLFFY